MEETKNKTKKTQKMLEVLEAVVSCMYNYRRKPYNFLRLIKLYRVTELNLTKFLHDVQK